MEPIAFASAFTGAAAIFYGVWLFKLLGQRRAYEAWQSSADELERLRKTRDTAAATAKSSAELRRRDAVIRQQGDEVERKRQRVNGLDHGTAHP